MENKLKLSLQDVKSVAITNKIKTADEILIPAYSSATSVKILMGYFSSSSFAEIAPGLATFLNNTNGSIKILISPHLTTQDLAISQMSEPELESYLSHTIFDISEGSDHVLKYTLACFAWMLAEKRMEIKIAKMNQNALFHPKIYIFKDGKETAVLHGSMNNTKTGISSNVENLALSKSWVSEERAEETKYYEDYFEQAFQGKEKDFKLYSLSEAVKQSIIQKYSGFMQEKPAELSWNTAADEPMDTSQNSSSCIKIPTHLIYETGDFKHQGDALKAWLDVDMAGILDMATGAGKTITSLICAHSFQEHFGKGLFIISAPQKPLMMQWINEVQDFGITPKSLSDAKSWDERSKLLKNAQRLLKRDISKAEIFVISNTLLKKNEFSEILKSLDVPIMLIADECHNLGVDFLESHMKQIIKGRLGLSATPDRQYDRKGTEYLSEFFGKICFRFRLDDAIGKCLTPYNYHIIPVYLDSIEMDEFAELSAEIRKLMWQNEHEDSPQLDHLLRQRRKVIETAGMKISLLKEKIEKNRHDLKHTLIYCTDKEPKQLEAVNELLKSLNIRFRQLTSEETSSKETTQKILHNFAQGTIEILTAKRVLDEGVNIPETQRAYVLASNTVERQWTQRRGRILRKCKEIGKTHAEIFDFVVLPPTLLNESSKLTLDDKKLIELELKRLKEFARLSQNKTQKGGPFEFLNELNIRLGHGQDAT